MGLGGLNYFMLVYRVRSGCLLRLAVVKRNRGGLVELEYIVRYRKTSLIKRDVLALLLMSAVIRQNEVSQQFSLTTLKNEIYF